MCCPASVGALATQRRCGNRWHTSGGYSWVWEKKFKNRSLALKEQDKSQLIDCGAWNCVVSYKGLEQAVGRIPFIGTDVKRQRKPREMSKWLVPGQLEAWIGIFECYGQRMVSSEAWPGAELSGGHEAPGALGWGLTRELETVLCNCGEIHKVPGEPTVGQIAPKQTKKARKGVFFLPSSLFYTVKKRGGGRKQ